MEQTAPNSCKSDGRDSGHGLSRCWRAARNAAALVLFAALFAASVPAAHRLDAKTFGWRRHEAIGTRPLLVIWIRQPDDTPKLELARRKQYYEETIFGRPERFSAYPEQLRQLEPTLRASITTRPAAGSLGVGQASSAPSTRPSRRRRTRGQWPASRS